VLGATSANRVVPALETKTALKETLRLISVVVSTAADEASNDRTEKIYSLDFWRPDRCYASRRFPDRVLKYALNFSISSAFGSKGPPHSSISSCSGCFGS